MTEMPDHFLMGTMRGSFIHKLQTLGENIVRPILSLQMRVPAINERSLSALESVEVNEQKIGLIDFSRPSDYRIKAIEAKSAAINVGDDISHLSGTSRLSTVESIESVRPGNTPYEGKVLNFSTNFQFCMKLNFIRINTIDT
jgi:dynein heavy chain, axonemal